MPQSAIAIWAQTRKLLYGAVRNLTDEQWLAIPDQFDNNIAWNVGHIIAVQQSLVYRLAGAKQYTDKAFSQRYRPGSSPADWESAPDIGALKTMLKSHSQTVVDDFAAGTLVDYMPYETSTGIKLASIEDGIVFNNFHEGLHLGTILALRNFL